MPSTQFATADELAARLGLTFSAEEKTRADALIASATGLIQAEAKQTIALVEDDMLIMRGTNDESILLPQRPVVGVSSVTLDDVPLSWYLDGNRLVRRGVLLAGVAGRYASVGVVGFGRRDQVLEIVYTHGYDPIPEAVKAICLEAVTRVWVNPGSVMRERMGSESTDFALQGTPNGLVLTKAEQRIVRRMFGSSVMTVTLT